jgi:hypothetical protein
MPCIALLWTTEQTSTAEPVSRGAVDWERGPSAAVSGMGEPTVYADGTVRYSRTSAAIASSAVQSRRRSQRI